VHDRLTSALQHVQTQHGHPFFQPSLVASARLLPAAIIAQLSVFRQPYFSSAAQAPSAAWRFQLQFASAAAYHPKSAFHVCQHRRARLQRRRVDYQIHCALNPPMDPLLAASALINDHYYASAHQYASVELLQTACCQCAVIVDLLQLNAHCPPTKHLETVRYRPECWQMAMSHAVGTEICSGKLTAAAHCHRHSDTLKPPRRLLNLLERPSVQQHYQTD